MFEIYAASASEHPEIVARIQDLDAVPRGEVGDDGPFLQLGYDEIDPAEVDHVLSYAAIARTNGPVGLPRLAQPVVSGTDWVLFPIGALRQHLAEVRKNCKSGTTVADFVSAVDDVAEYCERNDVLMIFRW